jgi:predicted transcriptional regulator
LSWPPLWIYFEYFKSLTKRSILAATPPPSRSSLRYCSSCGFGCIIIHSPCYASPGKLDLFNETVKYQRIRSRYNQELERLAELLFILASIDRLTLLSEIVIEKRRLSQLTAKLSATPQETSKHLTRLRDAKLIEKDSDGLFGLTAFGKTIVNLLPSIRFLTQNREYFLSHDISSLPLEFIERLGELQEGQYADKVGSILSHIQQVVQHADEYVWLMADHPLGGGEYVARSGKLERSSTVTWRVIIPAASGIDWTKIRADVGIHKGRIEYHLIEDSNNIKAGIALNEKIAGFTFPDLMGRLDFDSGFRSSNPLFCRWCRDLFLFHWNKPGKKVQL